MDPFNEPLNEIIFEKRNKSYGAYALRKEYTDSLKFGVLISYTVVITLVVLSLLLSNTEMIPPKLDFENLFKETIVDIPPPEPMKPDQPEEPKPKQNNVIPPVQELPQEVSDEPLELKDKPEEPAEPQEPALPDDNRGDVGTGKSGGGFTSNPEDSNGITLAPDVAPAMEGGVMNYLQRNLRYPSIAVENKTSGTVYLSFVVEKDGSVNDINVLKSIGDGCVEEAIRVVKKMKWNPGKAGGHPVRVQFTLPVKFVITP